ncbi:MAG TPA: GNAT family N-acetyltransferase [Pilimelia sp.]|nr:GNAT family N-acetyltransferase [Pilimelia sp.]
MNEIEVRPVGYDDPVAQQLVGAAMADLGARYGGPGDTAPVDAAEFAAPEGEFLVAFIDAEPVGCAGWRSRGDAGELAELKRMYTAPGARGKGVARRLLAEIEDSARRGGRRRLILECGDRQPEAVSLYHAYGFERIEDFGHYRHHAGVLSFGLEL